MHSTATHSGDELRESNFERLRDGKAKIQRHKNISRSIVKLKTFELVFRRKTLGACLRERRAESGCCVIKVYLSIKSIAEVEQLQCVRGASRAFYKVSVLTCSNLSCRLSCMCSGSSWHIRIHCRTIGSYMSSLSGGIET
jgi:hypothetical protein